MQIATDAIAIRIDPIVEALIARPPLAMMTGLRSPVFYRLRAAKCISKLDLAASPNADPYGNLPSHRAALE
jgi:hypothetical protein